MLRFFLTSVLSCLFSTNPRRASTISLYLLISSREVILPTHAYALSPSSATAVTVSVFTNDCIASICNASAYLQKYRACFCRVGVFFEDGKLHVVADTVTVCVNAGDGRVRVSPPGRAASSSPSHPSSVSFVAWIFATCSAVFVY